MSLNLIAFMDGLDADVLTLGLRLAHLVGAMILVGGTFYMRFALVPATDELENSAREKMMEAARVRWAKWVGIAALLLLASGMFNFVKNVIPYKLPSYYHILFGIKFLLALMIIALASIIAGKTSLAVKLRPKMKGYLNLTLVAILCLVAISNVLRYSKKTEKNDANTSISPTTATLQ